MVENYKLKYMQDKKPVTVYVPCEIKDSIYSLGTETGYVPLIPFKGIILTLDEWKEIQDKINHVEKKKYPIGGYAPGNYSCLCYNCKKEFIGDKLAVQCEICALKTNVNNPASKYEMIRVEDWKPELIKGEDYSEKVLTICEGKLCVMVYCFIKDKNNEWYYDWCNWYGGIDGYPKYDDGDDSPTHWMPLQSIIQRLKT